MLKGTLCSGEKPQQFVLWFLDKSSSENGFPCMCTPSMTVFPSWCVFVCFWFVLLVGWLAWVFLFMVCVIKNLP